MGFTLIYASEELIQNTIDKINLKSRKNSFEVIKKIDKNANAHGIE